MSKKKCIIDKYSTIYEYDVYVVVNPDKNILDKHFEWDDEEDKSILVENSGWDAYTNTNVHNKDDGKYCIVVIFNKIYNNSLKDINTCAHESNHVMMDIMSVAGMNYGKDSAEAYAYLLGWLTEMMYKTIHKAYE